MNRALDAGAGLRCRKLATLEALGRAVARAARHREPADRFAVDFCGIAVAFYHCSVLTKGQLLRDFDPALDGSKVLHVVTVGTVSLQISRTHGITVPSNARSNMSARELNVVHGELAVATRLSALARARMLSRALDTGTRHCTLHPTVHLKVGMALGRIQ